MHVTAQPEGLPPARWSGRGPLAQAFRALGADDLLEAARLVHALPYARSSSPEAALIEQRGTCSGKHALLAALATEADVAVDLLEVQTSWTVDGYPEAAAVLRAADLREVPELHVLLARDGVGVDLTFPPESGRAPMPVLGPPRRIRRSDLDGKPARHRALLGAYAQAHDLDPEHLWTAREACIAALSQRSVRQDQSAAAATLPLRQAILRPHQALSDCVFPGDEAPQAVHLVRWADGAIVAVGSLLPDPRPGGPSGSWRVRGMATVASARGRGHGRTILRGLLAAAALSGAEEVWCNARVAAESLYRRQGFERASEAFELPGIGPHYRLVRQL